MSDLRHTLLFVDDEADVLDILTRMFSRRYRVLTATSGRAALELLRRETVDVLVTDQRMPEMTGIELVTTARGEGIDVTTILLTGYTDPEDLIAAINQGQVYRYVTKPWDVNDLLITVKNAVEFAQLKRDKERLLRQLHQRVEALFVLYEVSRASANDPASYDAIIDRVLTAVARILPYDCGAALIAPDGSRGASLRLRCMGTVGEQALLGVKESMLGAYRKSSGLLLPEDRVITRVAGTTTQDATAPAIYASQLTVNLMAGGRPVGMLSLFSQRPNVFTEDDGVLLDVLANQTADAIQSLRSAEEEARHRMERMVESMADGVVLTDEKNDVVVMNPAARRLLRAGEDPAELTSRMMEERLGFAPFQLVRGWEYSGSQVLREDVVLFERHVQTTVTPVSDARGTLRGVCVVLRDITEQKRLEERKDEFVSMVSHELRTPLTSITGALDLVLNFMAGDINERQRRYLSLAKDSTEKLNGIVDDLLDLSKFAKGRLRMNFEVVYLEELVHRVVEKYGPAFGEKNVRVVPVLPQHPLRSVADPNRINQVLNNLLNNAVKFTPEGGEVRVELRATSSLPGYVVLSCWNSGEPIADSSLERIFDRFEQARTAANRTVRGTGLGLAICRNIVEAHGGRIWCEPCTDGVRFLAVLPTEPPHELMTAESLEVNPQPKPTDVKRGKVLVIEGEPEVGHIIKALLGARGYDVRLTVTAEEGLGAARNTHPDVVLVSVRLPDVEGLRLAEILRHDPETRRAPLLLTSAFDERQRAFRAGADAFLVRPLAADKLLATVDSLVRGSAGAPHGRVLVVDDDAKIASICREVLEGIGFDVAVAASLDEARRGLRERRPDVILLDVTLPDGDGFLFLEEIKAERASGHISVIFISARAETSSKVRALKLGGDDYLTKPFDALELGARVESVLRRKEQELSSSPTTQLPGSTAIEREVQRRLSARRPFAFCYLDLDNLKAYNDYYGFAKADGVVRQTGDLMREIFQQEGAPGDFLGHVAGDDFVFITSPESVDRICQRTIETFDRIIPLYYDRQDRERGHIEAEDRFGEKRRFPIMSVSVVAVMTDGVSHDHAELARRAADMKKQAKAILGSVFLRNDRERVVQSVAG
ncbi:two-component system sensor histidine kinase/response regulator [Corallococcus sp. H22C18031201]|uniref:response regulator n=1 Tax=Citreicoccus inhibens TaxID=2849499 RepID=UPI000E758C75|nr:response regulator [Citreicoccus inhibens]MBU8897842.1 response regulator [Citreicoccus inhibens]RJS24893.1 two-component system sensor histidine kinase/response regulator [Corallococcus sp. H22C18031201]